MTDYDKVCKILIDRCQSACEGMLVLDSCFWLSRGSNLGVKAKHDDNWMMFLFVRKNNGEVGLIYMPEKKSKKDRNAAIPLSNEEAVEEIFKISRENDIFFRLSTEAQIILKKNESLESLLVEYDLREEND